jgi:hypothetical protein
MLHAPTAANSMNLRSLLVRILASAWLVAGCGLGLGGCDYDSPITAGATDPVDARLLGVWIGADGKNPLQICRWDDSTYAVAMNNDVFRVHHSAVAGTAFVSVQSLKLGKYALFGFTLSGDDRRLTLRLLSDKVVPKTHREPAALAARIASNLQNPALYQTELTFVRKP